MTLAFVCVQLDTALEIFQLITGQKVCHYLGGDKGGGGQDKRWQMVTRGRGIKNLDFDDRHIYDLSMSDVNIYPAKFL